MKQLLFYTFGVLLIIGCQKEQIIPVEANVFADGRTWNINNLDIIPRGFENDAVWYNHDGAYANYGRLYSSEAAEAACSALGNNWRLPTFGEARELIIAYDGNYGFQDGNRTAYELLIKDGESGFNVLLGGTYSSTTDTFQALDKSGCYWTSSERTELGGIFGNQWRLSRAIFSFWRDSMMVNLYFSSGSGKCSCRCIKG